MFPKCPVCGFDDMPYPPVPFNVCPCCGTEFGVDDRKKSYPILQQEWISQGMPWFDDITFPPVQWDRLAQLYSLRVPVDFNVVEISGTLVPDAHVVVQTTQAVEWRDRSIILPANIRLAPA
jgi:hypothetical protein